MMMQKLRRALKILESFSWVSWQEEGRNKHGITVKLRTNNSLKKGSQ
jgi:hypothetical protein